METVRERKYREYREVFKRYNEVWNTYELCDPDWDYDIIESLEYELDCLEYKIVKLEKELKL